MASDAEVGEGQGGEFRPPHVRLLDKLSRHLLRLSNDFRNEVNANRRLAASAGQFTGRFQKESKRLKARADIVKQDVRPGFQQFCELAKKKSARYASKQTPKTELLDELAAMWSAAGARDLRVMQSRAAGKRGVGFAPVGSSGDEGGSDGT
ncbi:unnamed protein product [Pedinophyceae sp. YPF-701]|nr:unnamed protein product [Pedinophyceae sp. YPF-701]